MQRRYQRLLAFAGARIKRATAAARQAVMTDVDVTSDRRAADLAEAEAFASSAAELGAAVAKAAQVRAYLDVTGAATTPEARALLSRLWDRMPPRPPSIIRAAVEAELGAPPEKLFAKWDDEPLAAASLGQVHAAEDADGTRWAVKVQYPGVAETLADDLSSASLLRRVVGSELGENAVDATLAVMRAQLLGELDYRAEATWLDRFRRAFTGDADIVVPRVDAARSSGRLLTMARLDGTTLAAVAAADAETRQKAARAIFRFAFGGPLEHGIFNADPHPGNYLVDGGRVGFVDFGSSAELADETRGADRKLFLAIIHRDGEELRHAAHSEGLVAEARTFETAAWREWEAALSAPFLSRVAVTLTPPQVARMIALTGELLRERRIALPPSAMLLWRQRLGALAVIASLTPKLPFRKLLAELLDDGRNPQSLFDRWR
ncbi:MAG TPA: AarF/ABC1/UbiB kinase family protein [Polyangia bacterium]|jgi:predicted unusual protein kinase regulating ubiquinone biosynthesis (AarF/ABC1/UbiB family)|nr:AarF/ABC1/UbiB kinase family protein [Polyangia bacterium]